MRDRVKYSPNAERLLPGFVRVLNSQSARSLAQNERFTEWWISLKNRFGFRLIHDFVHFRDFVSFFFVSTETMNADDFNDHSKQDRAKNCTNLRESNKMMSIMARRPSRFMGRACGRVYSDFKLTPTISLKCYNLINNFMCNFYGRLENWLVPSYGLNWPHLQTMVTALYAS